MQAEDSAWREGYATLLEELDEDPAEGSSSIPPIPRPPPKSLKLMREETTAAAKAVPEGAPSAPKAMLEGSTKGKGKRAAQSKAGKGKKKKADDGTAVQASAAAADEDAEMEDGDAMQGVESTATAAAAAAPAGDAASVSALFSVLDPSELQSPAVPDRKDTEAFILQARKKALKEQCEYMRCVRVLRSI